MKQNLCERNTLIAQHDTGEWTDLSSLLEYVSHSAKALEIAMSLQSDQDWDTEIVTKEFGVKAKAESLGRIISHTAHHGGQLAIILKYADGAKQPGSEFQFMSISCSLQNCDLPCDHINCASHGPFSRISVEMA